MGLQLIFCVETNKKCKSDYIYINDTIEKFFAFDRAMIKLSFVFMDGKYKYANKSVIKEINKLIKDFSVSNRKNESSVIYCFDCDDYDINQRDNDFLKVAESYCSENNYKFVWFCKDIERVFIGEKVSDKDKKKKAVQFRERKGVKLIKAESLCANKYGSNRSNILNVLSSFEALHRRDRTL